MTIRQLRQRDFARAPLVAEMPFALSGGSQRPHRPGNLRPLREKNSQLPPRPDASILSASIPLFFIGRDHSGFWVAREAEGRNGGRFFLKRSAARFARTKSTPTGCATMFVEHAFELDIPNQGSRLAAALAAAIDVAERRAPTFVAFIGMAAAEWRKLVVQVSRALAGERRNREAVEKELFRGQYSLVSKSDDDLPIP